MYDPDQLVFLTRCLEETSHVPGACVEAGCGFGATTAFLKRFMQVTGIDKPYVGIDTFSGFVEEQVDYEIEHRGKDPMIRQTFNENKRTWVEESLRLAEVDGVQLVTRDVTQFDFDSLGGIAFCLLDVDLYKPIKAVLPKIYSALSEGGIIVVDDCVDGTEWDGANEAYVEFVRGYNLEETIVCRKLGVLRKRTGEAGPVGALMDAAPSIPVQVPLG
jgi:SAM-dependent methyltransferase